jgi:hypothetical protein
VSLLVVFKSKRRGSMQAVVRPRLLDRCLDGTWRLPSSRAAALDICLAKPVVALASRHKALSRR